ncbi:MATE family efflux transporter [uncultured Sulfitobacter sp.]|uniref:MATE family efflux transporter n=1 Tax=uncultured Sulfitobacter sp. TaxID=191468 RepID=UPI0030F8E683
MPDVDLSHKKLPQLMLRLGLPAMVGLSLNASHQIVDAAFVGQLGASPLAVLALMASLAGFAVAVGIGIGIGAASSVARALGAGETERARKISGLSFATAAALATVLWAALQLGMTPVLHLLSMPQETLPMARAYYPIQTLTVAFGIIQIVCDFTAIGRGHARMSMRTLALCFGLNMVLDPLYIFGFGLGLDGAAWATITAQLVTLSVWAVWFHTPARRPSWGSVRLLAPVLRVGMPEAASFAVTTFGLLAVLRLAAEHGGLESVAALGVALRLILFVTLPLEGFAIGVQPILSYAYGAGDGQRVARAQSLLLRFAPMICLMCAALLWIGATPLASVMSDVPAVVVETATHLRWLALSIPAFAIRLIGQISLQAAIRPRLAMLLGLAPMGWLLWPTLAFLLPTYGVSALPMAITLSAYLSACVALVLLKITSASPHPIGVSA